MQGVRDDLIKKGSKYAGAYQLKKESRDLLIDTFVRFGKSQLYVDADGNAHPADDPENYNRINSNGAVQKVPATALGLFAIAALDDNKLPAPCKSLSPYNFDEMQEGWTVTAEGDSAAFKTQLCGTVEATKNGRVLSRPLWWFPSSMGRRALVPLTYSNQISYPNRTAGIFVPPHAGETVTVGLALGYVGQGPGPWHNTFLGFWIFSNREEPQTVAVWDIPTDQLKASNYVVLTSKKTGVMIGLIVNLDHKL
ncbi:MAG: hypothetical protein V1495_06675 [Pseudomonadota bacterium]